jgi:hypothetical protein
MSAPLSVILSLQKCWAQKKTFEIFSKVVVYASFSRISFRASNIEREYIQVGGKVKVAVFSS